MRRVTELGRRFYRRENLCHGLLAGFGVPGAVIMALSWNHRLGWFAGMQGFNWAGVGFLLIAVGIASFSLSLKCPACGQTPTAGGFRGRARDSGVHFRPDSCPRCGAIFREQL